MSLALRFAAGALRVWMITGILLRVTRIRDAWDPFALVFYTTPWPAIAAGFATLGLHSYRLGKRHAVFRYVVFTAATIFTWIATSYYDEAPAPAASTPLRVALWNVARPESRLTHQAKWLRERDADIIALAEASPGSGSAVERWQQEFPGYAVAESRGNLLCLVRGQVQAHESGSLDEGSTYGKMRVRVRGSEITVIQVDIRASPRRSRRVALTRLVELTKQTSGALLVLGDFNTPRESRHLDPLRERLQLAFERSGRGIAETWPLYAPALSLDQIWSSAALRPVATRIGWMPLSDHRPIVAEFEPLQ
jgi:endonuclease/exonuclease/phosphatase (EEP) superfamily protein YafD